MNPLTRKLVAKELHLYRWLLIGGTAAGFAGLLCATSGEVGFNIGFIVWLTAVIALGVLLALFGVASERKERSQLFILSLPLSHRDYVRAKLLGLLTCFALAWAALSAGALALIAALPGIPDGLLPYGVLLCLFLLMNFSAVLCGALHITSEAAMGGLIILTNMSVSLFMMGVGRIAGLGEYLQAAVPVWNTPFWLLAAALLAATALFLALPLFFAARRRDLS
jgi:ABC-type transport system involved in multi-copper enzyme maturation permease subunit